MLQWDEAMKEANEIYRGLVHNIFCDNCHSHVACALNIMDKKLFGIQRWDMIKLCFIVFFRAKFLSLEGFVRQFGPFTFLCGLVFIVSVI